MATYTTEAQVSNLTTRISTETKALRTLINGNAGDLSALTTTAKTNLVAALNELDAAITNLESGGSATNLDELTDVTLTSPATGHLLRFNGSGWVNVLGTTHFDAAGSSATVQTNLTNHINAATGAHAATAISYTAGGTIAATNVQAAISEVATDAATALTAHINDTTDAHDASAISFVPGATGMTATDVQAALVEVHGKIATDIAAVIDSAPGALDTLNELAAALGDDANFATTINTALANRVRVDAAQSFTGPQQAQARANIGAAAAADIVTSTANFVTTFESGLV